MLHCKRKKSLVVGLVLLAQFMPAQTTNSKNLDKAYLRDYALTRGFMLGRPSRPKPTPDGKAVLFLRAQSRVAQQGLYIFDVESGKTKELLTPEQVLKGAAEHLSAEEKARRERQRISVGGFTDFQISDDSAYILVSLSGKLYVVTRATGKIQQLETGDDVLDPKFSPDSKSVSYVRAHDLYVLSLATGKSRRVTTGGTATLTHGLAEFVAQEELARFSGYWWSPDASHIVYEEADAGGVEIWHLADPEHPDRAPVSSYYPRPGKPNVKARLGIVSSSGGKTLWIDWDSHAFPYLVSTSWRKGTPLTLVVATRDQKEARVLVVDPTTGKTNNVLTAKDKDWVTIYKDMPYWLDDGSAFLWISEKEGSGPQLELHEKNGALSRVLVGADAGLIAFVDCDTAAGEVYYEASPDTKEDHVFKVSIKDGKTVALTHKQGLHSAAFSKNHGIYVLNGSQIDSMPRSSVHKSDGTRLGELPSVAEEPPVSPRVEFVRSDDSKKFEMDVVRPQDFDPSLRYPVIVDVYGGPSSPKVVATKRNYLLDQWLADQGFIVVSLDNRGTRGRGHDWERAIYGHFGSVPLDDQVAGIEWLTKKFPEMDRNRIGITGWSFGGYMSALAALRRPDVFKAAVAGAPVVDWFDYDSCYTERYLGLPEVNPQAYKESSLLTYAAGLSRPLLLVHGTTDDNVFFKHSLELADALFRAGRYFEILPLSGLTHMVPDPVVMEQLWSRISLHFQTHLGKPEPAK